MTPGEAATKELVEALDKTPMGTTLSQREASQGVDGKVLFDELNTLQEIPILPYQTGAEQKLFYQINRLTRVIKDLGKLVLR